MTLCVPVVRNKSSFLPSPPVITSRLVGACFVSIPKLFSFLDPPTPKAITFGSIPIVHAMISGGASGGFVLLL